MKLGKTRIRRAVLPLLLTVVIVFIFIFSSQPYRVQNIQPYLHRMLPLETAQRLMPNLAFRYDGKTYGRDINPLGMIEFLFRKSAHLFMYGMLAMSAALVFRLYVKRGAAALWLALLVVLAVAALDEWNQQFASSRTPAVQDVLVDLAGGVLGLAVLCGAERLYRRIKQPS